MGQYFKFFNFQLDVISTASIKDHGGLSWQAKVNHGTYEEVKKDFDEACLKNGWEEYDTMAIGDCGDIVYLSGDRIVKTTVESISLLKKVPILKDVLSNTIWDSNDEDGKG